MDHIAEIAKVPGFRLVGLCDPDQAVLEGKYVKKNPLPDVQKYRDLRKLLDEKNLDAVSIATPNHWHALAAIWAIQAGKDVYVEKPVSHNITEGRRIVEFARKHERMCQAGTQMRSSLQSIKQAVDYVQSGKLGKIKIARALNYKRRPSIGKVDGPQQPPETVDFDLWTGPAEKSPIMRKQFHYDWHWQWNTGDGDIGNQGIHEMDVARWFLGAPDISPMVLTVGGRVGYVDDGQTPNSCVVWHDYPQAPMIFEVRGLPQNASSKQMDAYKGVAIGVVIECEGGYVTVPNYTVAQVFDNNQVRRSRSSKARKATLAISSKRLGAVKRKTSTPTSRPVTFLLRSATSATSAIASVSRPIRSRSPSRSRPILPWRNRMAA